MTNLERRHLASPHLTTKEAAAYCQISPVMTTKEAAAYCKLSPSSLEKLRVSGLGPPYLKPTRRVIYYAEDLDGWLQSRRRNSTSQSN